MSKVVTITENFPVTVFQYLEMKLKGLRNDVMERAASIAREEAGRDAAVYTAREEHINLALRQIVNHHPKSEELLQVTPLDSKTKGDPFKENFPVSVFQFLELRLKRLRNEIMTRAAEIAREAAGPGALAYTVREEHVNRALKQVVNTRPKSEELLQVA
jgi:hypothetical protein